MSSEFLLMDEFVHFVQSILLIGAPHIYKYHLIQQKDNDIVNKELFWTLNRIMQNT